MSPNTPKQDQNAPERNKPGKSGQADTQQTPQRQNRSQEQQNREQDPRDELGLRSPAEHSESAPTRDTDTKATQFDGNPNPQGAASGTLKPKDDTPLTLKKKDGPRRP